MIRGAGFVAGFVRAVVLPPVLLWYALSLGQSVPASGGRTASAEAEPDAALGQARSLVEQGKLAEAERAVRQYLNAHANSADGHYLLGSIYFQEVHEEARGKASLPGVAENSADFNAGLADPKFADPKFKEAKEAKAKSSLAEYTEGAKYRVPSAVELKVVAFDYILLGDYPDADKWLTRALQSAPADAEVWYYLGRTKYNENRFEEAIDAFQRCILRIFARNIT
jgi:tetratricopeptide (TPR) repeat protein